MRVLQSAPGWRFFATGWRRSACPGPTKSPTMRAMMRWNWVLVAMVCVPVLALSGCEDKKKKLQPAEEPVKKKKAKEGEACRGQEDCEFGTSCADDKTCQTPKTIDCRGREQTCKIEGRCYGKNNRCVATDADCKKCDWCKKRGRCSARDGRCVAATDADCQGVCAKFGRCVAKDDGCIAVDDEACEASEWCQGYRFCKAEEGRCNRKKKP